MFDVKINEEKNRLYILLKGFMLPDEIQNAADAVIENATKLKPGFDAINDISEFRPSSSEGAMHIKRAQEFLSNNGLRVAVRIVGSALGNLQLKRMSKSAHVKYESYDAKTLADAENLLDTWKE